MEKGFRLELTEELDDTAHTVVGMGIRQFNRSQAGDNNYRRLCCFLYGPEDEILGGLVAATYWGWLYVDLLWVREDQRGKGYGRRLMEQVEAEARRRGAKHAYLDTFSYQAPGFYEKLGYQVFGQLPEFPDDHTRYFFTKTL
jgi:GNAT superfamily N-acetyltransferase